MKTLWTPWRIDHVLGIAPKAEGCLFEPSGQLPHDENTLLLYRDKDVIVLLNRFPYANGHLLVAPRQHVDCITQLDQNEASALMDMIKKCTEILTLHFSPNGINIGCNIGSAAGAGIADHLHFHLVPRWEGDHNFMTILAEVRTIPEHIQATYTKLLPHFIDLLSKREEQE